MNTIAISNYGLENVIRQPTPRRRRGMHRTRRHQTVSKANVAIRMIFFALAFGVIAWVLI
jgi:hypothetical protein